MLRHYRGTRAVAGRRSADSVTFRFEILRREDVTLMLLSGSLDINEAFGLREGLFAAVDDGPDRVVIDLEGVELLDSTGLSVLVAGVKRGRRRSPPTTIELVCATAKSLRALRRIQLDRVFLVRPSLDDALIGTSATVETECPELQSHLTTSSGADFPLADTSPLSGEPPVPSPV